MDWSKAKTILIIALIITNAFLITNYLKGSGDTGEIDNTEMLISMLEDSNIYVGDIPKEHKSMPPLSVHYVASDSRETEALIESTEIKVDISKAGDEEDKAKAYIEAAHDFVSYLGMMSEYAEPRFFEEGENDAVVEFECIRSDYKVDGSYMRCMFKDGKLCAFESNWLEPVEFSNRKLPTISASAALISFMTEREDSEPITVEKTEMVYWIDADTFDTETMIEDTALPAWKIEFSDGTAVYIDAAAR